MAYKGEANQGGSSKRVNVNQFYPEISLSLPKRDLEEAGQLYDGTESSSASRSGEVDETHGDTTSASLSSPRPSTEVFATEVGDDVIQHARQRQAQSGGSTGLLTLGGDWIIRKDDTTLNKVVVERSREHLTQALKKMENEEYTTALRLLEKAINLNPREVVCYVHRGEAFLRLCDFQSAILNYKKACVLDPNSADYYNRLAFIYYFHGQCLFDQKLFPEALEAFSRATEMRPDIIGYHTRSIACLASLQRHGECLALVNKRLEQEQENADLYVMRARLHRLFRNTTLCYYDVKDALAIEPSHSEALNLMKVLEEKAVEVKAQAMSLNLVGRHRDALQKISIAIETNPSQAEFHVLRGALHRKLGDFNAAIDDYLLALDKTDHDEENPVYGESQRQLLLTYNDFAVECFTKGFFEEAVILLNKAIKGEKQEKGLYINRGDCFLRQGNLVFAMADYQQAMEFDEKDSGTRSRVAVVHNEYGVQAYQDKNYPESESRLTLAIQHNPRKAQYYISRCRARQMMENSSGARLDILISLNLDPAHPEIASMMARLFPGKTVRDVMLSQAADKARKTLRQLILDASPLTAEEIEKLQLEGENATPRDDQGQGQKEFIPPIAGSSWKPGGCFPSLKQCMEEQDFNIRMACEKKIVGDRVKDLLQNRRPLKHTGGHVQEMPSDVPIGRRNKKGALVPLPPPKKGGSTGWKKFGRGISVASGQ